MADAPSSVAYLATAAVTYGATLLTAWAAFFKQMKEMRTDIQKQDERLTSQKDFDAYVKEQGTAKEEMKGKHAEVEKRLSIAETKLQALEKLKDEINQKLERTQDRMAKLATTEELSTLTNRQAEQFVGLSERLGRVIGQLEHWRTE